MTERNVCGMSDIVYSATEWPTNAAMIKDVARLGYLRSEWHTLDATPGRLAWWRCWKPDDLVCRWWNDEDGWDFRHMDYANETFDAVVLDPPYVSVGGRETTTIHTMHDAYGMGDAPTTPQGVQDDINAGLAECYRVVKKGGIVLVKSQSYVSSGNVFPGLFYTWLAAELLGFKLMDHLIHVSGPRPQPEDRGAQQHSRRNQSDLLILRRPKRARRVKK
jgi:hypothetical protein